MTAELTSLLALSLEGMAAEITRLNGLLLLCQRGPKPDPKEIGRLHRRLALCRLLLQSAVRSAQTRRDEARGPRARPHNL